jgi:hypothetical protein
LILKQKFAAIVPERFVSSRIIRRELSMAKHVKDNSVSAQTLRALENLDKTIKGLDDLTRGFANLMGHKIERGIDTKDDG